MSLFSSFYLAFLGWERAMLTKKSRYKNTLLFSAVSDDQNNFEGLRGREITQSTGVIEHEVQSGNRLDHLAYHYYNDDRLWWRIVDANPDILFASNMLDQSMEGAVILIPKIKE
jgi:hypothetical protein